MIKIEEKFNIIEKIETLNDCNKFIIDKKDLVPCLTFLKESEEYSTDILISITAVDLIEKIELIYNLYSTTKNKHYFISTKVYSDNPIVQSITSLFKSSMFEEREIFDLFGVEFCGNENMKRLLLQDSFVGNPLLKGYRQQLSERNSDE
ncbi:MAG: NADH-quinone oxidoreductase subunit C [Candidatus Gastranaerophilaceae bacterium]